MIGFNVVLDTKYSEINNVMNVKLPIEFLFGYSAVLALVAVAFARLSSLLMPVGTIVSNIATLPHWAISAGNGDGMESRGAFSTAKVVLVIFEVTTINRDLDSALIGGLS